MNKIPVGKLALRVEGDWWAAYYARKDTMQDALLLGKIRICIVKEEKGQALFLDLMQHAVSNIIEEVCHEKPTWAEPTKAPESERAGRA